MKNLTFALSLACITTGCGGPSSAPRPTPDFEVIVLEKPTGPFTTTPLHSGNSACRSTSVSGPNTDEGVYRCGEYDSHLLFDPRQNPLRVVSMISNTDGSLSAHVSDGCERYICPVDTACMADEHDATRCLTPGCCIAHRLTLLP